MARWRFKLDTSLPGELGQIADWVNAAEEILHREMNFDPMKLSPEENFNRFSKLNEEFTVRDFIDNLRRPALSLRSGHFQRQGNHRHDLSAGQTRSSRCQQTHFQRTSRASERASRHDLAHARAARSLLGLRRDALESANIRHSTGDTHDRTQPEARRSKPHRVIAQRVQGRYTFSTSHQLTFSAASTISTMRRSWLTWKRSYLS